MKPILYDLKKTLTSLPVMGVMIVIVVFSLGIVPLIGASSSTSAGQSGSSALYYHDSSGYHFLIYAFNPYGQPLNGVSFNVTISLEGVTYSAVGTSNSSGFAALVVDAPPSTDADRSLVTIQQQSGMGSSYQYGASIGSLQDGQIATLSNLGGPLNVVTDPSNSSRNDVLVFYAGTFLATPSDYSIYYSYSNVMLQQYPPSEGNMTLLGHLQSLVQIMPLPEPSNVSNAYCVVALFASNGTFVASTGLQVLNEQPNSINANNLASSFFSGILTFFVPLMAIFAAYSSYGRDKTTGVLESVLSRPVTRRGLILSRYISVVVAVCVAVAITVLIVDIIVGTMLGTYLAPFFIAEAMVSIMVEAAAFIGLMFLLSRLLKSNGALIGTGIALFLFLVLFWSIVPFLVLKVIGGTYNSATYLQVDIGSSFFNPSSFFNLAEILRTGISGGTQIQPSAYGLNIFTLVIDGLVWIAWPLILAVYLAVKRD